MARPLLYGFPRSVFRRGAAGSRVVDTVTPLASAAAWFLTFMAVGYFLSGHARWLLAIITRDRGFIVGSWLGLAALGARCFLPVGRREVNEDYLRKMIPRITSN